MTAVIGTERLTSRQFSIKLSVATKVGIKIRGYCHKRKTLTKYNIPLVGLSILIRKTLLDDKPNVKLPSSYIHTSQKVTSFVLFYNLFPALGVMCLTF